MHVWLVEALSSARMRSRNWPPQNNEFSKEIYRKKEDESSVEKNQPHDKP